MPEERSSGVVLRELPLPMRLVIAIFLISVGIGYLSALVQLHFQQASPGKPLPGPKEVVDNYYGRTGTSQIERLVTADENMPMNGSGSMRSAFTKNSSGWKGNIRERSEQKKISLEQAERELRQERDLEAQALVSWVRAGARDQDYSAHALPDPLASALGAAPDQGFFSRDEQTKKVTADVRSIVEVRCVRCHSRGKGGAAGEIHLNTVAGIRDYCAPETTGGGMALRKLAQSTHVHLLGFSMLYGLTGLLFACTSYPHWVRLLVSPWPLLAQVADISCWWLGRLDPIFAQAIMATGGLVAVGLLTQILGILFNLFDKPGRIVLLLLLALAGATGVLLQTTVIGPYLAKEKGPSTPAVVLPVEQPASVPAGEGPKPQTLPDVTYSEQVASLVYTNCTLCHRPGEAAPFALVSYNDVRKHARTMLRAMTARYMPPWQPEPGYGEFCDERRLTTQQINLFKKWIETGMAEGDRAKAPKQPDYGSGWVLGKPDLVVSMDQPFEVPAGGPDIYRNFVLPTGLTENKWVSAVAFQATAPSVVHHVLYFVDDTGNARNLAGKDGKPGFEGMGFRATSQLGGWAVGAIPHRLPAGLAYPIHKGTDLVIQTHFHPTGKAEKCKLTLGLYFAAKPPTRTLISFQVPPAYGMFSGVDIPPGKADFRIEDTFTLPADVDLVNVTPHAHYLGKVLKAEARLPDGTVKPLIWIKDWDFAWQGTYDYKQFVRLPRGTVIRSEVVWDNSANNPRNPTVPPMRVTWGEGSKDEMGSVIFRAVAADEKDVPLVEAAFRRHMAQTYNAAVKRGDKIDLAQFGIKKEMLEKKLAAFLARSKGKEVGFKDIDGKSQQPLSVEGAKANVLIFLTQDCPISNGYTPEIKALLNDFKDKPVRFFAVMVDPDLTAEAARKHAKEFGLTLPVLLDPKHDLVKPTGVTVTPEVAVLTGLNNVAYRGRIDDTYPGLGKKRDAPTRRDLREALAAILADKPVAVPRTEAVGCFIPDLP